MTRKLILLPLILLFVSCTITKRVHRPGYHIQWRKITPSNSVDKSSSKIKEGESIERDEVLLKTRKVEPVNDFLVAPNPTPVAQFSDDKNLTRILDKPETPKGRLESVNTKTEEEDGSSRVILAKQKAAPPIFWRTPPQSLKKLGITLIILGSLFLFASLLVYLGAFSGNGGYGWINFFLDLVSISEWFWIFVFILLFILIAYLFYLVVLHVLGGPLIGIIVGLILFALGISFYALGKRRTPEPPNA